MFTGPSANCLSLWLSIRTKHLGFLFSLLTILACAAAGVRLLAQAPVNVTTWRYDQTHVGANTSETELSPAVVNATNFGKLFTLTVDTSVYAQPLYVAGLHMNDGRVHNVLFIATELDTIYAFDADSNGGANASPIWKVTLLDSAHGAAPGATAVPHSDTGSNDIGPTIGITATPVIDLSTNTMYVVGKTKESSSYVQRLHAIDLTTGAERAGSPVAIGATISGTGNGSSGGKLSFSPLWQNNRAALGLYNGHVYVAFGAHGDNGPWHGWLFAYDANTLAQTAVVCTSPNGYGNGVWQSGAGLPIDNGGAGGRLFLTTGNGTFAPAPPFDASSEFGDSTVAFDLANGGLQPIDIFTPFNQATLSSSDKDQGSGGILMVPDQQGSTPHILIQIGKEGRILALNRDGLGGYATGVTSNTNALQDIPNELSGGLWTTPAYWEGNVYMWAKGDVPKLFKMNSGVLDTTPASKSSISSLFPGANFTISSDGAQNGIAWAVRTDQYTTHGPQVLYAFDATDLSHLLYASDANPTRDGGGQSMKFAIPVVANGKVYVAALGQIDVYGLFNGLPNAAAPMISPNGGTFSSPQSVTLSTSTPSANIFYTLDGSAPSPSSNLYTGPISISTDTTVRAIASASGYIQSAVSSAVFSFLNQTPPVSFTPPAGSYSSAQQVVLSDSDASASIYYTTDGTVPTSASAHYSGPIAVAASQTLKAIALDPALQNSPVTVATYTIQAGAPTINFPNGFSSAAGLTLNGSTVNTNDSRLQLTTGVLHQAGSVFWNQPVGVKAFTTDFSFQLSAGIADGITFTLQNVGATALGGSGSALGYAGIAKSVAIKFDLYNNVGEGTDSTGIYTGGAVPTLPAVDMTSSGVVLRSGDSMVAHITYDGTTLTMQLTDPVVNKTFTLSKLINIPQVIGSNTAYVGFTGSTGGYASSQKILYWTYSAQTPQAATSAPVFSPPAGSYTTAQTVSLSSATTGAAIYYTTNGSTPTTSSTLYTAPVAVGAGSTTLQAIAVANGAAQSSVSSATYTIAAALTPAPTITPAGGTYTTAQSVTLADTAAGAVIYYTTDGSAPTTNSPVYSTAVTVSKSETIKAIAIAAGMPASTITSATYTIQSGAPVIDYSGGFTSAANLSLQGTAIVTQNVLQLASATAPYKAAATWFSQPVDISSFITDFDFQLTSAQADGFTFTLQNAGSTAIGPSGSGLGYGASQPGGGGGIGHSVTIKFDLYSNDGEGTDSTGVYTNGASPTIPATDMTASGVKLNSGHPLHAHINYDGTNLTLVLTDTATAASFTKTTAVNIPGIVGSTKAYAGFTAGTGGLAMMARILHWTLQSGVSTAAATQITGAVSPAQATATLTSASLEPAQTLIMTAETQAASAPAHATVGLNSDTVGEPTYSPRPGVFHRDTTVSLACDTPGATIHYTVDGSQPTADSAIYEAPILVKGTALTIKAYTSMPGKKDSPVVTGNYHIQP